MLYRVVKPRRGPRELVKRNLTIYSKCGVATWEDPLDGFQLLFTGAAEMSCVIGDTNIGGTAWVGDEYKWTDHDACLAVVGVGEKILESASECDQLLFETQRRHLIEPSQDIEAYKSGSDATIPISGDGTAKENNINVSGRTLKSTTSIELELKQDANLQREVLKSEPRRAAVPTTRMTSNNDAAISINARHHGLPKAVIDMGVQRWESKVWKWEFRRQRGDLQESRIYIWLVISLFEGENLSR
ncbi:uncharacterized protein HD556DRAFT_1306286 [Suillus plorans]|uniref:Uncharacterized protein n=1 Tax=Suillus plorans TaxID=116603 RepID=A0A9P7DMA0_9AGAM|nr:uncharacterized protein HD556DRAFT_1306286 [Suillus plorans]KAG1798260.1 hypothetical protein HD556DRAFT_1306286 [Suillus plorans]